MKNRLDDKFKQQILNNIDSEENYLKQVDELRDELGLSLFTGTLIKGEAEKLERKMFEKIAIVEFIRSCKDEEDSFNC